MRNANFASLLAGIGISFSLLVPRAAEACWTCTTDSQCPTGFSCDEKVGCMPTVDCNSDSDCGCGMRCVTDTATECTSTAGSTTDSTCHAVNACAPVWQAGCSVDSDCGDGFACVENGSLCNSSGCTALAQCQPKADDPVACNADGDCPSGWSCLDASDLGESCVNPGGPASVGGTIATPPDPSDAGPSSSDAAAPNLTLGGPAKTVSSIPKVCRPPYWGLSISYEGQGPVPNGQGAASVSSCTNIEATRAGYSGGDPKSGSIGGCSTGQAHASDEGAPLWTLGAALAGVAVLLRRKRNAAAKI